MELLTHSNFGVQSGLFPLELLKLDPSSLVGMVDPNKVCWDTLSINLMNKDGAKAGLFQLLLGFDPSRLIGTLNV